MTRQSLYLDLNSMCLQFPRSAVYSRSFLLGSTQTHFFLFMQTKQQSNPFIQKILFPIASAIHEIAKVIGAEKTQSDILPFFKKLFEKSDDQIKFLLIKNLPNLLQLFSQNARDDLVDIYLHVQKDKNKWRYRYHVAKQIPDLLDLYSQETIFKIIMPIIIKLCQDEVYTVREMAAQHVFKLIDKFKSPLNELFLVSNLLRFYESQKYNQRQIFIIIVSKLFYDTELFNEKFAQKILNMAQDPSINVRITLGTIIRSYELQQPEAYAKISVLDQIRQILIKDPSQNIRYLFQDKQTIQKGSSSGDADQICDKEQDQHIQEKTSQEDQIDQSNQDQTSDNQQIKPQDQEIKDQQTEDQIDQQEQDNSCTDQDEKDKQDPMEKNQDQPKEDPQMSEQNQDFIQQKESNESQDKELQKEEEEQDQGQKKKKSNFLIQKIRKTKRINDTYLSDIFIYKVYQYLNGSISQTTNRILPQ